jgi:PBSX family phage terminase large subunit
MFEDTEFEGRYVESRSRYYLPDGGVIWLLSADREESLEGGQIDGVWIDEGGQISQNAWIAIQGRLGQKESPALITTTPYGRNWLKHDFFDRWTGGDPDYYVRQWSSYQNPAYSMREYMRAKKVMTEQRFAMRYDGQFVRLSGLVYPDMSRCIIEAVEPPGGYLVGGIDFGWNDPFAALAGTLFIADEKLSKQFGVPEKTDVLYIWYERYKRTTPLKQHSQALPKGHEWFGDPSRPDSIDELCTSGHTVSGQRHEIIVGVDAINQRIYTRRLLISNRCKALLAEAEQYSYPKKDEDESMGDKPVDGLNHALDALRYMVMGLDAGRLAVEQAA